MELLYQSLFLQLSDSGIKYICAVVVMMILTVTTIMAGLAAIYSIKAIARNPEITKSIWAFFLQVFALIEINTFIAVVVAIIFLFFV